LSVANQIAQRKPRSYSRRRQLRAIQVGMMHALAANEFRPIWWSAPASAPERRYYAGDPTLKGVLQLETIWRGLTVMMYFRSPGAPCSISLASDFLIPHDGIQKLIDDNLPYRTWRMRSCRFISSPPISSPARPVVLSRDRPRRRSSPLPRSPRGFRAGSLQDFYLSDGASRPTRDQGWLSRKGARLITLPTGYACATHTPRSRGRQRAACADAVDRAAIGERIGRLAPDIEYFVVPPLCPLVGSPYDLSRTSDHIERAIQSTTRGCATWLEKNAFRRRCARIATESESG